jgi:hypothetical protein
MFSLHIEKVETLDSRGLQAGLDLYCAALDGSSCEGFMPQTIPQVLICWASFVQNRGRAAFPLLQYGMPFLQGIQRDENYSCPAAVIVIA